ncbi:MAG: phage major capsid protein [Rhodobacteraceae bacterium]|nr:phage major capsid protein [Paracoccaceae bacterium]
MLKSMKISMDQSARRERLAELSNTEELNEDGRNELRSLTEAYQNAEVEYRAAVLLEEAEREQIKEPDGAGKEFETECRSFSLSGMVSRLTEGRPLDGRELEVSQELEQRNGAGRNGGVLVPWEALEQRADAVTDATAGTSQELASRPTMNALERFFEQSVAQRFGVRALQVSGTPAFPEVTGGGSLSWVAEGAGADAAAITTTSTTPTIKTATARYVVTRQATRQNSALESILRRDLSEQMRVGIDLAAFQGTGANDQPAGLETVLTGARAIDVSDIASFTDMHLYATQLWESAKLSDNAGIKFAGAPIVRQTLVDTLITGTAVSEYDRFRGAGFSGVWSQQVSAQGARDGTDKGASTVYLSAGGGHALMPTWGGVEMIIDPYSESKTGKVAITAFAFLDLLFQRTATHFLKLENVQDRA